MTATDVAKLVEALAWPAVATLCFVNLYPQFAKLLETMAASLTVKTVKARLFGVEVELTPQEIKAAVDELLEEISVPTNELPNEDVLLLRRIAAEEGRVTVSDLDRDFRRNESHLHSQLRRLRDLHLVRPSGGGRWLLTSLPVMTRFGRLVYKLSPKTALSAP